MSKMSVCIIAAFRLINPLPGGALVTPNKGMTVWGGFRDLPFTTPDLLSSASVNTVCLQHHRKYNQKQPDIKAPIKVLIFLINQER